MPVCVINNAKWQVRAFRFCHDANSSLHTFSDTTNRYAHKTPPYGGGRYEPLNGAGLFSTVVKPRAYNDGICLSSHTRLPPTTHRKIIAMRIKPRRMAVVSLTSPMCNFGLRLMYALCIDLLPTSYLHQHCLVRSN